MAQISLMSGSAIEAREVKSTTSDANGGEILAALMVQFKVKTPRKL
jgi:hypothetical protein